jgi:hypothetical protein
MSATVESQKEIYLGGVRFPIVGQVRPSLVSVMPGRVIIGESSLTDDLVASNWVVSDQRGGILIEEMDEATHQDRCYWSTSNLGFKKHITLPILATDCGGATVASQPQVGYVGAGTANYAASGNLTPAFPATIEYRNLFILQVTIRNTSETPTTPSGWTLLYGPDSTGTGRQWLYYKFAVGTESGTLTVTTNASTYCMARIYVFENVALSSFTEGADFGTGTDDSIECPSLTTINTKRLAVAFVFLNESLDVGDFTGESGGDWEEAVAEVKYPSYTVGCLQLQTATMASAGTISGGSYTLSEAAPWGVRSFALIPYQAEPSSNDAYLIFDYNGVTYAFLGPYLQVFDNDNDDFLDNSHVFWANPTDVMVFDGAQVVAFGANDNIYQKGLPSLELNRFITNHKFDDWVAGYPTGWGFDIQGGTVSQNTDTDYIHKGLFSVKFTGDVGEESIYMRQKLPFSSALIGKVVTVTAYGENLGGDSSLYVKSSDTTTTNFGNTAAGFIQKTVAHTIDAGSTSLEIGIDFTNEGASDYLYVDYFEISISGFTDWLDMKQEGKYFASVGQTMYMVDGDGKFYTSKAGIEWVYKCTIPDQFNIVNSLSTYRDTYGNLIPYIGTDVGDFAYDTEGEQLVRTDLKLPSHPMGGKHPVHWRGARYVPCGLDVIRYLVGGSASISSIGLNKDDGLPAEYQGEITGLYGGPNELFALVDSTYGSGTVYSSIMSYDDLGWQCKWLSSTAGKAIKCALLSPAYDEYRLFFGANNKVYHIPIERNLRNPLKIPSYPFAASSVHISPNFDADWAGDKLGLDVTLECKGMTSTETVTIKYRIDHLETDIDTGWTTLGIIEENGEFKFKLPKDKNEGLVFRDIQFRYDLARGTTTTLTPDIQVVRLRYLKLLDTKWGWAVTLDCSAKYKDNSKSQLITKVKEIIAAKKLQEFTFKNDAGGKFTDFVKVSNAGGAEDTGSEWNGEYNLVLVAP